jgi:sulfite reductase (NADPH) flavoprotein alpha-component
MAKDVDVALHDIVADQGQMSVEQAAEFVKQLKKEKRYQRDVY